MTNNDHPELLLEEYNAILISPLGVLKDFQMGPMPLIRWAITDNEYLNNSYLVIKKINLAIAWIIMKGNIKLVYTKVITNLAKQLLDQFQIDYKAEVIEEELKDDDLCMWEKATKDCKNIDDAFEVIIKCSTDSNYPHVD